MTTHINRSNGAAGASFQLVLLNLYHGEKMVVTRLQIPLLVFAVGGSWALHSSPYQKALIAEEKWGFDVSELKPVHFIRR